MKKFIALIFGLLLAVACISQTTAWYNPTSTGVVFNSFTNPTDGYGDDQIRAMLAASSMPGSQDYGGYGIMDLSAYTPVGVEVRIEIRNNNSAGHTQAYVEISVNGGASWTTTGNTAITAGNWSEEVFVLGGATDLWGLTGVTGANFTNANFLVRITFVNDGSLWYSDLDYSQVRVYYSTGTGGTPTANKYFISNSGFDSNSGTSPTDPWATITKLKTVLSSLVAGDSVFFARGSQWDDVAIQLNDLSGTASAPIVFSAYGSGKKPILTGLHTITGFTQSGNIWTYTSSQYVKRNKENRLDCYSSINGSDYDVKTNFLGYIHINGIPYTVGKYPNTGTLSFESVNTTGYTWGTDNQASWTTNQWSGSHLLGMQGDWSCVKALINSNTANTLSFNNEFDSQFGELESGMKYRIINSTAVLDMDGEYYHNYSNTSISIYWSSGLLSSQTVKIPVMDSVLSLSNCSYITIEELDLRGSRVNVAKIRASSNIRFIYNDIAYAGWNGIHTTGCTSFWAYGNRIHHAGNGIFGIYNTNQRFTRNRITRINEDASLADVEGMIGNGIVVKSMQVGSVIDNNYLDTIDYCGIHQHEDLGNTSPPFLITKNFVTNFCWNRTDGAALYSVSHNENVNKRINGNIVYKSAPNSSWVNGNTHTEGIYLDNTHPYTVVDSNTVFNTPNAVFINYGGNNNSIKDNVFVNFTGSSAPSGISGALYPQAWGGVNNLTFLRNDVVVTTSASGYMAINWHGADNGVAGTWTFGTSGVTSNNNRYYNPFNSTSNIIKFKEYYGAEYDMTLSAWSSATGLDASSTYNQNGWSWANASSMGITSDQFVFVFANWSHTSHTYNLGAVTFVDLGGVQYTGSIQVPAFRSKVLFVKSADATSILGVDNPLYLDPMTDLGITSGGGTPSDGGDDPLPSLTGKKVIVYRLKYR